GRAPARALLPPGVAGGHPPVARLPARRTGSNVYTQALAREWRRAGHDVTVVCQERHPERYDIGGATVVVPELPDRLLPVFVLDRYEGLEAQLLQELSARERRRYVDANAEVLRALGAPDLLFTNHVLMGG